MSHDTMTGWIELADERRFWESKLGNSMPQIVERQHLHLGSAIFSLPCRIMNALSHLRSDDDAR